MVQAQTADTYRPTYTLTPGTVHTYKGTFTRSSSGSFTGFAGKVEATLRYTVQSLKGNVAVVRQQYLYQQTMTADEAAGGGTMSNSGQFDKKLLRNVYGSAVQVDRTSVDYPLNPIDVDDPHAGLIEYYSFEGMTIGFPDKPIKVGDSWHNKGTISYMVRGQGQFVSMPYTVDYTLSDVKIENGHTMLVVKSDAKINFPKQTVKQKSTKMDFERSITCAVNWTMHAVTKFDLQAGEIASASFENTTSDYGIDFMNKEYYSKSVKKGSFVRDTKADAEKINPTKVKESMDDLN